MIHERLKFYEVFRSDTNIFSYFTSVKGLKDIKIMYALLRAMCANRYISVWIQYYYVDDNKEFIADALHDIANEIITLFGDKWDKIYETLSLDYNPLSNYKGIETQKRDNTNLSKVYGINSENGVNDNSNDFNETLEITREGYNNINPTRAIYNELSLANQNQYIKTIINDIKNYLTLDVY